MSVMTYALLCMLVYTALVASVFVVVLSVLRIRDYVRQRR